MSVVAETIRLIGSRRRSELGIARSAETGRPSPENANTIRKALDGIASFSSSRWFRWDNANKIRKGHNVLPMTIVVADDHAAVRKSLRLLIECDPLLHLIGEATDGLEAIRFVRTLQPDLLLLDIKMPLMSGIEVLQCLHNEKNPVAILMLSNHSEPLYVSAAERLGARGFIAKDSGIEALFEAIHAVREGLSAGDHHVGPDISIPLSSDKNPQETH